MIYQQDINGKRVSPLVGIGLIALIVFSIMAVGTLEQLIARWTGFRYGSMVVWVIVAAEALLVMRLSVLEQRYVLTEERLLVMNRYGDHERVLYDIPLSAMAAVGPEKDVFARYGNGQAYDRAVTRGSDIPVSALAWRGDGKTRLLLFQPDEKLTALLRERIDGQAEQDAPADPA